MFVVVTGVTGVTSGAGTIVATVVAASVGTGVGGVGEGVGALVGTVVAVGDALGTLVAVGDAVGTLVAVVVGDAVGEGVSFTQVPPAFISYAPWFR